MNRITKQSKKWVMGIAALVGILLIFLTLILAFSDNAIPLLMITIVTLAAISGGISIYIRVHRSKYAATLNEEYYEAYETVMIGLRSSALGAHERKDILLDVADLMHTAQQEGRAVVDVLGKDIGRFVERTIAAYGYRDKFVFNLLYGLQSMIISLVIIQVAIYLMRGTTLFYDTTIGVMILPYLGLLSFVLLPLMRHFIAKQKLLWTILLPVLLIAGFFAINSILRNYGELLPWTKFYLDGEVVIISEWWVLLVLGFAFASCFALKSLIHRRAIKSL